MVIFKNFWWFSIWVLIWSWWLMVFILRPMLIFCPSCLRSNDFSMYSVDLLISLPHSSSFTLIFCDLQVLQLESILELHWCGKGEKKPPMITLKHSLWWALDFSLAFTCIFSSLCFGDKGRPAALGFSDGYKSHAEYLAKPSVSFLGPRMERN